MEPGRKDFVHQAARRRVNADDGSILRIAKDHPTGADAQPVKAGEIILERLDIAPPRGEAEDRGFQSSARFGGQRALVFAHLFADVNFNRQGRMRGRVYLCLRDRLAGHA